MAKEPRTEESQPRLSPSMRKLVAAIASSGSAGRPTYGPLEQVQLAEAIQALIREEIAVTLGRAIASVEDRPRRPLAT